MATKKSKTRRKRGGKNWNCTCKLANASVVAAAKSSVGQARDSAAEKIQTAFRKATATKKLGELQTAAKKQQEAAAAKIQAMRRGMKARTAVAALRTGKGKKGGGRRRKTRKMSRRRRHR